MVNGNSLNLISTSVYSACSICFIYLFSNLQISFEFMSNLSLQKGSLSFHSASFSQSKLTDAAMQVISFPITPPTSILKKNA